MTPAATLAFLVATVAAVLYGLLGYIRVPRLPKHLLGHAVVYDPELLTREQGAALLALIKRLRDFPVVSNAEGGFYNLTHEHIGEAQPIEKGGRCAHPYLVPSVDRTMCVLPGRIDVGRHLLLSGGVDGLKERHSSIVSRVLSFMRYHFNMDAYPEVAELFASSRFQELASAVCPPNKRVLDPFQFNFIAQVPGQTVPHHIDTAYFWGADRFHVPQWLLAVMVFSGLWRDELVDQVQVVAYLHDWQASADRGGRLLYWADAGTPGVIPPSPLSGVSMDGSKIVHAAEVFEPSVPPPRLNKDRRNVLSYSPSSDRWAISADGEPVPDAEWATHDLRFSVVYRARCFASEQDKERFATQRRPSASTARAAELDDPMVDDAGGDDMISLESILDRLIRDMVARGRVTDRTALDAIPRLDLALALIAEYVHYPLPEARAATIPWNYCVVASAMQSPGWPGVAGWVDALLLRPLGCGSV